jgi:uncharacterized protein (DUF1778 family)
MTVARRVPRKNDRLELRLEPRQRELLDSAARATGVSTSGFVLEHATAAAQQVIADRTTFVLPTERWDAFVNLLERPEQPLEGLAAFLARRSIASRVTRYACRALTADHDRSTFDCGSVAQSEWLRRLLARRRTRLAST